MGKNPAALEFDASKIIDSLPGLNIIIKDKSNDFRILAASKAWIRKEGLKIKEVQGLPFLDLFAEPAFHLEEKAFRALREHLEQVIMTGRPIDLAGQELENRSHQPPASCWWDFHIAPLPDGSGRISHLLISIDDKTETARLERHFHELLEMSPDAIVVVGENSKILDINASAEKLFGYSKSELVGRKIETLVPPRYRHQHRLSHAEYFSKPKVRPMGSGLQLHAIKKDGTEFPVEINLSPLLFGKSSQIATIVRDVSDKMRNESQLRSSERRYRLLFNENPYPVFIYDPSSLSILEVNESAVSTYGFSRDELKQMKIQQIFISIPGDGGMAASQKRYQPGSRRLVWHTKKKNGDILVGEIRTSFLDYYGKLAQQVLVNDITENIRLQKELTLQGKLREKQITEAIFIAQEEEREHIGKELHDNINQLLATAKLCFMSVEPEHDINDELMSSGLKALDSAITGIRNLSKGLVRNEILQAGLVNSIKDLIDTINLTRKLQIELKVAGPVEENMKEEQKLAIYRIIQEQLSNVIRHSHASHVRIDLGRKAHQLVLRIDDDGKGFNARTARRGIGITNIINRARLMDGDVRIDTSPDKGCMLEVQMKTAPVNNISNDQA